MVTRADERDCGALRLGRSINVEGASLFVPRDKLVDDPANDGRPPTKTPAESEAYDLGTVAEEARVMAHMSNAMRAGYFSTVPTDIYLGTHMNEAMWIFPTNDLEGYMNPNGPRYCDSVRDAEWSVYKGKRTETYNPTCRPWYQRAVLADDQEAIIHNPIDYAVRLPELKALSQPLCKTPVLSAMVACSAVPSTFRRLVRVWLATH
eukprot:1343799-Rhodomonas_salina.1